MTTERYAAINFDCEHSENLPAFLQQLNISLAFTCYQAGRLMLVRSDGENLDINFIRVERPMGLTATESGMTLGAFTQIIDFQRNDGLIQQLNQPLIRIEEDMTAPRIKSEREKLSEAQAAREKPKKGTLPQKEQALVDYQKRLHEPVDPRVDACFISRSSHHSGMINTHDIDWGDEGLWVVNSNFSCLCTMDPDYSFVPRWKPHFISELKPEDRCHVNGMALRDGKPAYVTTFSKDDEPGKWREGDEFEGTLMDVATNQILLDGLVFPHSPRWYRDRVYYCNSGLGQICSYRPDTGEHAVLSEVLGFTRGMDFYGPFLFVGLSKARESGVSRITPLARKSDRTGSGIRLINIEDGSETGFIRFASNVDQIYDLTVIPDCSFPELLDPTHPRMRNHYSHPELRTFAK